MVDGQWKKLTDQQAIQLARKAGCDEAALALIDNEATRPEALLARLVDNQFWTDGVRLMAHALPLREALWWGCLCVRAAYGEKLGKEDAELVTAAEGFVYKPDDAHSEAAYKQAQHSPSKNAAQMLAMAAGFGGGKVRVNEGHQVPVPTEPCAPMISGAVMIAATTVAPEDIPATYALFLQSAQEIARGDNGRKAFEGAA